MLVLGFFYEGVITQTSYCVLFCRTNISAIAVQMSTPLAKPGSQCALCYDTSSDDYKLGHLYALDSTTAFHHYCLVSYYTMLIQFFLIHTYYQMIPKTDKCHTWVVLMPF